ncbi:MAG: hypothetical protein E4H15_02275 [Syntrophobacterales bacterium]|nr:MAG: hypothetical protein E4H15_02275 [Syntrophobacterales bacterium]
MKKNTKLSTVLAWVIGYLLLMDVGINIILPYPKDPRNISPSELAQFFEYGRSVEGKLARMTRKTDNESAPILSTGWLEAPRVRTVTKGAGEASRPKVTVYGMSHSVQLADDMARLDSSVMIRSFGAPGAVPSWSYSAYLSDRQQYHSDVVVLAVMTIGIPFICTTAGTTNHFDSVWPYTYPRLIQRDGRLESLPPPFLSLDGYRSYFFDPDRWATYVGWLKANDRFYDPVLYRKTIFDKSSLVRMLRRAYAYSSRRKKEAQVYDERNGFNRGSEEVKVLLSIVENFAEEARRDGSIPVIYIVNNLFTGSRLFDLLGNALIGHDISYLSSHGICAPDDPRNYLPDTHFTPQKNLELAGAMLEVIRKCLSKR